MTLSFRIVRIPKGRGSYREIYIVSEDDRVELRSLLPQLYKIQESRDILGASYAFQKDKNCALMALQHIGHCYTLSMDLENFFESVTARHVKDVLPQDLIDRCFIDGRLRQGLPTSPVISNIAFISFDSAIVLALRKQKINVVYTRYADDLVFSYADASAGILRPQKVRAKTGLGDKLHTRLLTLGRERMFVPLLREVAQFGGPVQQLCRFEAELLGQLGRWNLVAGGCALSVPEASAAGVAAGSGSLLATRSSEMRTSSLMRMMRCASS
jgi:hypothetical protein